MSDVLPTEVQVLPTRFGLISEVLGPRCEQFHNDCMTCVAWAMSDEIDRLAHERNRMREALHLIAEGTFTEKGAEDWAKAVLRDRPAGDVGDQHGS